jgi:hypothetical protein
MAFPSLRGPAANRPRLVVHVASLAIVNNQRYPLSDDFYLPFRKVAVMDIPDSKAGSPSSRQVTPMTITGREAAVGFWEVRMYQSDLSNPLDPAAEIT